MLRINVRGIFRDQHRDEVLTRIDKVLAEIKALRDDQKRVDDAVATSEAMRERGFGSLTRTLPSMPAEWSDEIATQEAKDAATEPLEFPRRGSFREHSQEFDS